MKKIVTLLLVPLMLLPAACATVYTAASIEAWVVDEETKKPVEGVIVVANWQLLEAGLDGSKPRGQLMIMETVTDRDGRFAFPAWGPKAAVTGRLGADSPGLAFFKPGYFPTQQSNELIDMNGPLFTASRWNGKTIPMARHENDWAKYLDRHASLKVTLGFATVYSQECEWKKLPKMLAALEKEGKQLTSQGRKDAWGITSLDSIRPDTKCGSVEQFFSEYLK